MDPYISLLIVDDQGIVREGLKAFIRPIPDIQIIGEACNGLEAIEMTARLKPDIILMDLVMPKMDGIEATQQILQRNPDARILMITSFSEDERVVRAIKAGALGYLLKDTSPQELEAGMRAVYKGDSYLPPDIARKIIRNIDNHAQPDEPENILDHLTPRELQTLKLVAKGYSNDEIANNLVISVWTVRSHLASLMKKLQVKNRTQASLAAIRMGIITVDP